MKKILCATLAAFVAMFGLAGLFNGVLIRSYVAAHVDPAFLRNPPSLVFIAAGYLLLALGMAWLYSRRTRREAWSPAADFTFGAAVGFFWTLPIGLVLHGAYRFPTLALAFDTLWALLEQGIGGLLIGAVFAKVGPRAAPDHSSGR
ncbi:MAG: hypothetical protein HY302_01895 [Opitutae bacterium]|nr:hypothetical protein [Opitutae bacterium]